MLDDDIKIFLNVVFTIKTLGSSIKLSFIAKAHLLIYSNKAACFVFGKEGNFRVITHALFICPDTTDVTQQDSS
jgi:hypothetical protein